MRDNDEIYEIVYERENNDLYRWEKTYFMKKQYGSWYIDKLYRYQYADGVYRTSLDGHFSFNNKEAIKSLIKLLLASEWSGPGENWFKDFLKKLVCEEKDE